MITAKIGRVAHLNRRLGSTIDPSISNRYTSSLGVPKQSERQNTAQYLGFTAN
jgi:hypothetical protein